MKKFFCIVLILVLSVCGLGTSCEKRKPGLPEITDCLMDTDFIPIKSSIENADNTFIGLVAAEEGGKPNVRHSVKVIETIKGDFAAGEIFAIANAYTKDEKTLILLENDDFLLNDHLYVFHVKQLEMQILVIIASNISILEDAVNDAFNRETLAPTVLENSEIVQEYRRVYRAIVSEQQGNGEK